MHLLLQPSTPHVGHSPPLHALQAHRCRRHPRPAHISRRPPRMPPMLPQTASSLTALLWSVATLAAQRACTAAGALATAGGHEQAAVAGMRRDRPPEVARGDDVTFGWRCWLFPAGMEHRLACSRHALPMCSPC